MKEQTREAATAARVAIGHALREIADDDSVPFGQWLNTQEAYFKLKWTERALADGFPAADFDQGVATRDGHASLLAGFTVAEPSNPFITTAVHLDHVVELGDDGDIEIEIHVNGDTLGVLTEPRGEVPA